MEENHRWLEAAHNFKGHSVNRRSFFAKLEYHAPVFASVRLQSIFFFLANIFDYLAYLN